jgi:hypothetical protein
MPVAGVCDPPDGRELNEAALQLALLPFAPAYEITSGLAQG